MSSTIKVLIADDESIGRQLLEAILMPEGYQLIMAADGQEALNAALHELPDFILLDVMMPKMDGFEVCKRIRQDAATAHIPVFLITALDDRDSRIRGIDSGADDYISKPFDRLEIMAKIKNSANRIHQQKTGQSGNPEKTISQTQQPETDRKLILALQQLILNSEKKRCYSFRSSSQTSTESKHALAVEDQSTILISNKLDTGNAALTNAIFITIWKEKIRNPFSNLHEVLLACIEGFNELIQNNKLEMLAKAGISIGMLRVNPETKELQACGVNQTLFVQAKDIMLGSKVPSVYQSYYLQGTQTLKFPETISTVLLSPNAYETINQQEFLQFANRELIQVNDQKFRDKLNQKFKTTEDVFGVKMVV